ncbi:MAG: FKBP-type peptidyl-prolyl cis-trans isomerase [Flavipsychrobacter sp.]
MKKLFIASLSVLVLGNAAHAQKKQYTGFSKTPRGLEYKIFPGPNANGRKGGITDMLTMHVHMYVNDSLIFDSRKVNKNEPVPLQIQQPMFGGDIAEGLPMLSVGDSAIFLVPVDSILKMGQQLPPFMKPGDKLEYQVVLTSIKSQEELKKEAEEHATKQVAVDDSAIKAYLKENNITAKKTANGLYYTIDKPGSGPEAKNGQIVTVNYTGKLLNGRVFDSNVDSNFRHVQPFQFGLGKGQVIKGWDEGVALMKKGEKATFYIPSSLAYGQRSPSPMIPADAILVFNVEVTDITADNAQPAEPVKATSSQPAKNVKSKKK